MFPLFFQPVLG